MPNITKAELLQRGLQLAAGYKYCRKCETMKRTSEFYTLRRAPSGLAPRCKVCQDAASSSWSARNPAKRKTIGRRNQLRRRLGITPEERSAFLIAHGSRCATCPATGSLCVDHDHETGRIRGVLCSACNSALGLLKEDTERMLRLADYVRRQNAYN